MQPMMRLSETIRARTQACAVLGSEQAPMVTIKDVAREAGFSVTTVSRALNDYGDVSETTRARIREVAERLNYHPSAVARSLQRSSSNAIGLLIPLALHRAH